MAADGRAPAQRPLPLRGRGGDRQPEPRERFLEEHRERARGRRRHLGRRRDVAPGEPSIAIAAKGLRRVRRDRHRSEARTSTRDATAARSRTRSTRSREILASLHEPDGAVAVRRLLRRRRASSPPPSATRSRACRSTRTPTAREVGVPALHGEPGFTTLERLWTRPTLEVNAARGRRPLHRDPAPRERPRHLPPRPGPGPGGDPRRRRRHVETNCPAGVEAVVEGAPGAVPAYAIPPDHFAVRAATSALRTVYPDQETAARPDRRHAARCDALRGDPRPEDAPLLVLDRRRAAARAERVLPARAASTRVCGPGPSSGNCCQRRRPRPRRDPYAFGIVIET